MSTTARNAIVEHTLPNGLRIVCEVLPNVQSAAAAFWAHTGSRDEAPDEHGVSHFLEHMCFKGTAKRDWHAINVRFDELGSIYNAYTSRERTIYYGWLPAARIAEQIELLADMMRPALPPEEFETERKVILEEIAMTADSFEHNVWDALHKACFDGHPLGHEILGEKETIERLARETMVAYHRRRYAPDNVTLVVCGHVEPEAVFAAAGRCCGDWQPAGTQTHDPDPPELPRGRFKRVLERFTQQSLVRIAPSVPEGSEQAETVQVFQSIFGGANSRCFWNIVQKGLATDAGALWIGYRDCGLLAMYADGDPARCEAMLEALDAEIREVMRQGVSDEEVQRVRNRRRTQIAQEAENPRTRLMQIIDDLEALGYVRSPEQRLAAIEQVTPKSVRAYLERCPLDDGLLLSCGPRDWPADATAI